MQHRNADHRRIVEAQLVHYEQSLNSVRSSAGRGGNSRAVLVHHARKISEARRELARLDAGAEIPAEA